METVAISALLAQAGNPGTGDPGGAPAFADIPFALLLVSVILWLLSLLLLVEASQFKQRAEQGARIAPHEEATASGWLFMFRKVRLDITIPLILSLVVLGIWSEYLSRVRGMSGLFHLLPSYFFHAPTMVTPGFLLASLVPGVVALLRFTTGVILLPTTTASSKASGLAGALVTIVQLIGSGISLIRALN